MPYKTDDERIKNLRPLISPAILVEELPLVDATANLVSTRRQEIGDIIHGSDDRLLVVVGPCSIHDPRAALEYADKLKVAIDNFQDDLLIVMRVYFEKPRTTIGWKGLINDPDLNESYEINKGLRTARKLLLDISNLGVPIGTEVLDTIIPQFVADLISWGASVARTTESHFHL